MTGEQQGTEGFTLVEMAMVLVVIGIVMLTVLPALSAIRMGSQRSLTQSNLQSLMTATAAYVQANGCLPCPTPANTLGSGFGRVRGDSSAAPLACNGCATPEGIPPFMSLGIPFANAHDGGGHWITMRVDPALTSSSFASIVPPTKPCSCTASGASCVASSPVCSCAIVNNLCTVSALQAGISLQGMCQANLSSSIGASPVRIYTPPNTSTSQNAAVIFVSHGVNGYGSFFASAQVSYTGANGSPTPFPPGSLSCSAGNYAACNAASSSGAAVFYNAPGSGCDVPYDDMLAFADRNTLVSMLGNGSCQTVW